MMNVQKNLTCCIIEIVNNCLQELAEHDPPVDVLITRIESAISAIHSVMESDPSVTNWLSSGLCMLEEGLSLLYKLDFEPEFTYSIPRGPARMEIAAEKLEYLLSLHFKVPDIADMLHISPRTIFNRFNEYGISVTQTYTVISDDQLNETVGQIMRLHPSTGYKRMKGYLVSGGIRVTDYRVRECMRIVDPVGVLQRTGAHGAVKRRTYKVPCSNYIWHLDGHHKLIRWKIITRAGIDGMSRVVTYICAIGNNRADTHFDAFRKGVDIYGVPLHCRSDKGKENMLIAKFMIENRGAGRGSHICGRSVHNQRIERLWKDVFYGCIGDYYNLFTKMEDDMVLDVENEQHLFVLHKLFLPRINESLAMFVAGWNRHPISGVHNYTPAQLFIRHLPPPDYDLLPDLAAMIQRILHCAEFINL